MTLRLLLLLLLSSPVLGADLQGVGVFTTLDKPWFLTGLYTNKEKQPQKLEFRIVQEKISAYRFRQLWLDAFAVAHHDLVWERYQNDLDTFFAVLQGPLQSNDHVVIEQQTDATLVHINYREHARLSVDFLPLLVSTLTARIAPVPELRAGLLGELPAAEQRNLMRDYDRASPELRRIAETARWLRKRQQAAAEYSGSVSQL